VDIIELAIAIPVSGGRVLSARLWRPKEGRHPAVLDASPYRVSDLFAPLMEAQLPVLAARGYAALAIDISGSGNSAGLLRDEYAPQEVDDLVEAIAFAAGQDWCDGQIALSGLSWAAFAALRAAGRKPPALKAMALGGVSEDGWRTDIHYLGGALYTGHIDWAGVMLMFNALPPDPKQFAGDWRAAWKERLEANVPWLVEWLSHPTRDSYWAAKAAPVDGDVPLLLYGGLADKYATSVLRIASAWCGPVRTIIGPWEHAPPDIAARGPRIGFLHEAARWFDHHLKGIDTGAMAEAPLRLWVSAPSGDGHWTARDWPASSPATWELCAADDQLRAERAPSQGGWQRLANGPRTPLALGPDLYEDVPASFDSAAFADTYAATTPQRDAATELFGAPLVRLKARWRGPGGQIIARLIDRGPDGRTRRLCTGAICLGGVEGDGVSIEFPLQPMAWRLEAGHKLSLVLCADGWPTFWPAPHETVVEIREVQLSVPILPAETHAAPNFAPASAARAVRAGPLKWINADREAIAWPPRENAPAHSATTAAHHLAANGTDYFVASRFELRLSEGWQGWAAKSYRVAFERPGWSIRIDTRLEVTSTKDTFEIAWSIEARDGETLIHRADRRVDVPRSTF
jgi:putative CocE/NonD family hydrolase